MNYWMNYAKTNKRIWEGDKWNKEDLYKLSNELSIEEMVELLSIPNKLLFEGYQNVPCVIAKNQDLLKMKK